MSSEEVVEELFQSLFKDERNVFLTGMGGTGKTYVINQLIELCLARGIKVTPTSTTGCSAINILYGRTLHSALGIGLGRESASVLARQIIQNKTKKAAWMRRLIIIDECSMLNNELFDKLEEVARAIVPIYRQDRVFGGCISYRQESSR
jgi:thymidine kinase